LKSYVSLKTKTSLASPDDIKRRVRVHYIIRRVRMGKRELRDSFPPVPSVWASFDGVFEAVVTSIDLIKRTVTVKTQEVDTGKVEEEVFPLTVFVETHKRLR